MKWHHTPIKWLEYNKTTTNKLVISIAGGVERQEFSFLACTNGKWYSYFGSQYGSFL